jgi:hypothetical protein
VPQSISETHTSGIGPAPDGLLIAYTNYSIPADVKRSRDSSVGIALGYGLDDRGSRVLFPAGAGNFSLHHRVQISSGAHPVSYLMGTGALSLGVKRPGREVDHSPSPSAKINE